MSMSIPEHFTYPLLSRLPPQSFVIEYREVYPDQVKESYTENDILNFSFRGAPNEFLIPDSCNLVAEVGVDVEYSDAATGDQRNPAENANPQYSAAPRFGPSWIGSVRESLNSQSLCTYSLCNEADTNVYLSHRCISSRRNAQYRASYVNKQDSVAGTTQNPNQFYVDDTLSIGDSDEFEIFDLKSSGCSSRSQRRFAINYKADPEAPFKYLGGYHYSIPLSLLSVVANGSSLVPVGLFGSYASSSWNLEIKVAKNIYAVSAGSTYDATGTPITQNVQNYQVCRPRFVCKYVKILQPEVMDSILTLYDKSATIDLPNGQKIPMSLQLNCLNYLTSSHLLPAQSQTAVIRIPVSYPSVRGIMFGLVRQSNVPTTVSSAPGSRNYHIQKGPFQFKSFQIKVGSTCIMECPYKSGVNCNDINGWFNFENKKSGHLFSAYPSWAENLREEGPEDAYWITMFNGEQENRGIGHYGFSFENMNHSVTTDLSSRQQSSGLDTRSIGYIDLHVEYGQLDPDTLLPTNPVDQPYRMVVMTCVDEIYEVSRSGAKEITHSVL